MRPEQEKVSKYRKITVTARSAILYDGNVGQGKLYLQRLRGFVVPQLRSAQTLDVIVGTEDIIFVQPIDDPFMITVLNNLSPKLYHQLPRTEILGRRETVLCQTFGEEFVAQLKAADLYGYFVQNLSINPGEWNETPAVGKPLPEGEQYVTMRSKPWDRQGRVRTSQDQNYKPYLKGKA